MLPASKHVEGLYLGENGLLATANPKSILIDCSTISPKVAQAVAGAARAKGFAMVDAPVSGGTAGAQAGTLTFMVGADDQTFNEVKPVLSHMGKNIVHCGDVGAGCRKGFLVRCQLLAQHGMLTQQRPDQAQDRQRRDAFSRAGFTDDRQRLARGEREAARKCREELPRASGRNGVVGQRYNGEARRGEFRRQLPRKKRDGKVVEAGTPASW